MEGFGGSIHHKRRSPILPNPTADCLNLVRFLRGSSGSEWNRNESRVEIRTGGNERERKRDGTHLPPVVELSALAGAQREQSAG